MPVLKTYGKRAKHATSVIQACGVCHQYSQEVMKQYALARLRMNTAKNRKEHIKGVWHGSTKGDSDYLKDRADSESGMDSVSGKRRTSGIDHEYDSQLELWPSNGNGAESTMDNPAGDG